jgi:Eco57I restriction-modification methylase/TaqI-like C-terminal specificity domain
MNAEIQLHQACLPGLCPVEEATGILAHSTSADSRGAIFTKREVVEFILDLVGYKSSAALCEMRLLEPSCGGGDFLVPAIKRLLAAREVLMQKGRTVPALDHCIRAIELHQATFDGARALVLSTLVAGGIENSEAQRLVGIWLTRADFLLTASPGQFDVVVGNPPYVRQELVPEALLLEYRRRYATLYDRADLYIPFIERSLQLLATQGQLGFICADRWTKNRYGGPLRAMVARDYHLRIYVDMVDTPAFHSDVVAYPAITIIARGPAGSTLVAERPEISSQGLSILAAALTNPVAPLPAGIHRLESVVQGDQPWMLNTSLTTMLIRRIESIFPTIEQSGCKVGIGVATGADRVFIGQYGQMDVEPDRKLPLATTKDIATGRVQWTGTGVINPFTDTGQLVNLAEYPRLSNHLDTHKDMILARHVAKKDPSRWYRTIDRITPSLARRPKLLIPDIKGAAQVVYEPGELYPHHNLYYVISDTWDLRALQAVLLSSLTRLFIASYSTKMRGGFLRFQAQYLRRIRVPMWDQVTPALRERLVHAAERLDIAACDDAVADLYKLSADERAILAAP